jgi:hypothetical protein
VHVSVGLRPLALDWTQRVHAGSALPHALLPVRVLVVVVVVVVAADVAAGAVGVGGGQGGVGGAGGVINAAGDPAAGRKKMGRRRLSTRPPRQCRADATAEAPEYGQELAMAPHFGARAPR